jgi:hypothetical protein
MTLKCFGVLELIVSNLLVSSSGLARVHNALTSEQEYVGTTFWIDIPKWTQVPGLCPNVQNDIVWLRYSVTTSSNYAAATQAQQTIDLSNAQNSQSLPAQSSSNLQGASNPLAGSSQGQVTPNQASQPSVSQQQPISLQRHVFMSSKVGGHYLLSQWDTSVPTPQTDREFFKKLRTCYISTRGFWRYYFGFKVFSHCDFYKVSHLSSTMYMSSDLMHSSERMVRQRSAHQKRNYPSADIAEVVNNRVLNIRHIIMLQSQRGTTPL